MIILPSRFGKADQIFKTRKAEAGCEIKCNEGNIWNETKKTNQREGGNGLHFALVIGYSDPGAPFVFPTARLHIELGSK
jgi:hypothetical protein